MLRDAGWHVVEGPEGELDRAAAAAGRGRLAVPVRCGIGRSVPTLLSTLVAAAKLTDAEVVTCAATYTGTAGPRAAWRGTSRWAARRRRAFTTTASVWAVRSFAGTPSSVSAASSSMGLPRSGDATSSAGPRLAGTCRFEVVPGAAPGVRPVDGRRPALAAADGDDGPARCGPIGGRSRRRSRTSRAGSFTLPARDPSDEGDRDVYVRELEERLDRIASSRSWRGTAALRDAMERVRRPELDRDASSRTSGTAEPQRREQDGHGTTAARRHRVAEQVPGHQPDGARSSPPRGSTPPTMHQPVGPHDEVLLVLRAERDAVVDRRARSGRPTPPRRTAACPGRGPAGRC